MRLRAKRLPLVQIPLWTIVTGQPEFRAEALERSDSLWTIVTWALRD